MRSEKEIAEVRALARDGLNRCQIARRTGIPRTTVRDWLNGKVPGRNPRRAACRHLEFDPATLPRADYSYLLGMYLGDGCLSNTAKGSFRLRITLDMRYPGIITECAAAMRAVSPINVVSVYKKFGCNAMEVGCYWKLWPSVFPQHGRGLKWKRKIELTDWQREIVEEHPKAFLRGLIHSDGCRCINKSMGREYVRYMFMNASEDIREMFGRTCEQLGIGWRQPKERTISIARRKDTAFLDEFIGPKY